MSSASSPRASVLLPVRDAAPTLEAALRSVARQRDVSFECVVVDDGSRDASPAIAESFARRDGRFRVLRREREGLVPALNAGLGHCRGAYVARMDADDWMHRDRLRLQAALLEGSPELAGVGCHVRLFPRSALRDGMRRYESWLNGIRDDHDVAREVFVECPLAHPTLLLRTGLLHDLGYRDAGWPEDYDLVLRALAAGHRLGVVTRRLLGWRDRPERLSRLGAPYRAERFVACKAHFLAGGFLSQEPHYVLWGYGGTGRALRRALLSHGRQPSHVVEVHPGRLGQRIHGAPVVPPEALDSLRPRRIVVAVSGAGARAEIREALTSMRFRELRDFVHVA